MAASDAFYIELRDETVIPLLEEFGTVYTVRAKGTYNAGEVVEGATRTVKGVVADQNELASIDPSTGSASWVGKKNLLLDPNVAFLPDEEIQVNGKWYPSSDVNELKPGDITVMYILDVTR